MNDPRLLSVTITFLLSALGMSLAGVFEVRPSDTEALADGTPVIPWVEPGTETWKQGPAFFSVADEETGMSGQGWLAATREHLLIRLVTADADHVPPAIETPWAGDGVELCIDARGDSTRGLAQDSEGAHGPDDAKYMLALTADGPFITRTVAGSGALRGPLPDGSITAAYDELRKQTSYELRLSWEDLQTPPGLYTALGIAVQFNDLDAGQEDKNVLKWGEGTYGPFRPGLFNRVGAHIPTGDYSAIARGESVLWSARDAGTLTLVKGAAEAELSVTLGAETWAETLPATAGLARYDLVLNPADRAVPSMPFAVELRKADGAVLARQEGALELPEAMFHALDTRLGELIDGDNHPLFDRHLRSVRALAMSEWARIDLYRASDPQSAESARQMLLSMLDGLAGEAATAEPFLNGRRNMIFAYVSPKDRSVQYYLFALPHDWEPEKSYPLFFELHGSGNPNPLSSVSRYLALLEEDAIADGAPRTFAARQRNGFYCQPFGRGNLGYRNIGEVDVWEAYDDIHANFRIDPDRRYLYGFSMGGGGTWSIGTRTPDRWAALAIMAGGTWSESGRHGLGRNIAHLPVFIWCGERDRLFRYVEIFREEIERYGGTPVIRTTPDLAHNYREDIQEEMINWLQQFTRKRPDAFSFVADERMHAGTWGITMVRDLTVSGLPSFTCRIDGNTVHIDSTGTAGLEVKAGEDGLGLEGEIKVIWNGVESYTGPAETVSLGQPLPRGRR